MKESIIEMLQKECLRINTLRDKIIKKFTLKDDSALFKEILKEMLDKGLVRLDKSGQLVCLKINQ